MAANAPGPRPTPPQALVISIVIVTVVAISFRPRPANGPSTRPGPVARRHRRRHLGRLTGRLADDRRHATGQRSRSASCRSSPPWRPPDGTRRGSRPTRRSRWRAGPTSQRRRSPRGSSSPPRPASRSIPRPTVGRRRYARMPRLTPGRTYRVALRTAAEAAAGSWAFHVRGPITVTSTIPGNAMTACPGPDRHRGHVRSGRRGGDGRPLHDLAGRRRVGSNDTAGRRSSSRIGLALATLYTVTIDHGLGRTGTDLTLAGGRRPPVRDRGHQHGPADPAAVLARRHRGRAQGSTGHRRHRDRAAVRRRHAGTGAHDRACQGLSAGRALDAAAGILAAFLAAPRWGDFTDPLMPTDGAAGRGGRQGQARSARRGHAPVALPDRAAGGAIHRRAAGPAPVARVPPGDPDLGVGLGVDRSDRRLAQRRHDRPCGRGRHRGGPERPGARPCQRRRVADRPDAGRHRAATGSRSRRGDSRRRRRSFARHRRPARWSSSRSVSRVPARATAENGPRSPPRPTRPTGR